MANSIIAGNDFRLIIRAKKSTGAYLADMDLADVEDLRIYLTRAGRSKVLQSYTLDDEGHAVIYVSAGVVTNATYGIEMVGVYGGARLRAHNTSVFTISGHGGGNSGVLNDYYADIVFVINVAATDVYVQNAIEAHNEDEASHPHLLQLIEEAGDVDDVQIDGVSIVDGNKIAKIDSSQFGKVDDVKVNGTSVVSNKEANISIPEKVSDLPNDAEYATMSELTTGLDAKQDTITAVAEPTIADDGGNPSASVDFNDGEMAFAFKNLKLRFSDLTPEERATLKGDKGDQGDSAVYNPSSPDAPDFVMANTTGQSTTKSMTQKAITDELTFGIDDTLDITEAASTNKGFSFYGNCFATDYLRYEFSGTPTNNQFNYDLYVQYVGDENLTKLQNEITSLANSIILDDDISRVYFYVRKTAGLSTLRVYSLDYSTVKGSINKLQDSIKTTTESPLTGWRRGVGHPGATVGNQWTVDNTVRSHYYLKRDPSMKYIVLTSNANQPVRLRFSTNYTTPVNGAEYGFISALTVPAGGKTAKAPIPDNCEYILMWHMNGNGDLSPSAVSFFCDKVESLSKDLEELATCTDIPSDVLDWNVGDGQPGLNTADVWTVEANMNRTHLWLKRDPSMKYITFTANSSTQSILRFSADYETPVNGATYGIVGSASTPAGTTRKVRIPDECEYMIFFRTTKSNSTSFIPDSIIISYDAGSVAEETTLTDKAMYQTLPLINSLYMPEDFEGDTLSAKIVALNDFIKSLPADGKKVVYFGKNAEYEFTKAFEIPSNTTVLLDNCVVHLVPDTVDNIFRSANIIPDEEYPFGVASEITGTLENIRILGRNATLKTLWTGDQTYGIGEFGWRGVLVVLSFTEGYEIAGLRTENSLTYQFSCGPRSNYGKIHDLVLNTYRHLSNGDGIGVAGHDIDIYNISGRTEDDTIAMGTSDEYRQELRPSERDIAASVIYGKAEHGDTYNVRICNVHCSGENHVVAFVPGGTRKIHDIYISDVSDEYNEDYAKKAVVKIYDGSYNGHYTDGDMYNFFINCVQAKYAQKAIIVQGMPHTSKIHHIGYNDVGIDNISGINFATANTDVSNVYQGLSFDADKKIHQSIREILGDYTEREVTE